MMGRPRKTPDDGTDSSDGIHNVKIPWMVVIVVTGGGHGGGDGRDGGDCRQYFYFIVVDKVVRMVEMVATRVVEAPIKKAPKKTPRTGASGAF